MCNGEESECCDEATSDEDAPQVLAIQVLATAAAPTPVRSIHLEGTVHGILVQILVDSGSSSSFVNAALVPQLKNIVSVPLNISVQAASGA